MKRGGIIPTVKCLGGGTYSGCVELELVLRGPFFLLRLLILLLFIFPF